MSEPSTSSTGRPRDPEVTTKALRAAQRVYGRLGLSGFTFDAVAAEAEVGKPALYRRWASREHLLRQALLTYSLVPDEDVHRDLRAQLVEITYNTLVHLRSDEGVAMLRIFVERLAAPEIFADLEHQLRTVTHAATTGMVAAAISRGEVAPDTDADAVIEMITGAAYMHSSRDGTSRNDETPAAARAHCERVVDVVLKGIDYSAPRRADQGSR